jgi:hypothetical protein
MPWAAVVEFMQGMFGKVLPQSTAIDALLACKQHDDETLKQYAQRFQMLVAAATQYDPVGVGVAVGCFKAGLHPEERVLLPVNDPRTKRPWAELKLAIAHALEYAVKRSAPVDVPPAAAPPAELPQFKKRKFNKQRSFSVNQQGMPVVHLQYANAGVPMYPSAVFPPPQYQPPAAPAPPPQFPPSVMHHPQFMAAGQPGAMYAFSAGYNQPPAPPAMPPAVPGNCFLCGEPGHYKMHCPNRVRQGGGRGGGRMSGQPPHHQPHFPRGKQ